VRSRLLHLLALLTLESPVTEEAIAWAVAAVMADEDTEAIRVVAGLSSSAGRDELTPWLRRAAHEVGVRLPTREESLWILVTSETDHLPIGEDREHWNPDVRREKDGEIHAYEEAIHAQMVPHCEAFATRIDHDMGRLAEFFVPDERMPDGATGGPVATRSAPRGPARAT
jgi:hypothetical protein